MADKEPKENSLQHQANRITINHLPREINLEIISRLPIESLLQAKRVCHSWRTLFQDPILASMQFSRTAMNQNPCILLHDVENHLSSLHFSAASTDIHTKTRLFVPMIPQFSVSGSCNGLLCLFDPLHTKEAYIFNPFTTFYTQLPKPAHFPTQQRVATGFGFSSTTKEYKVVRIVYYKKHNPNPEETIRPPPEDSEVEVLTVKKGELVWRSKGKTCYQIWGKPSNVLVNGRLHWLSKPRGYQAPVTIISFDLEDEEFGVVPNPTYKRFAIFCTHLAVLRGCLSGVERGWGLIDIWVLKEYGVQESWVKEFRIGYSLPRDLPRGNQDFDVPNIFVKSWEARVLCMFENGQILIEHAGRSLVSYDPSDGSLKVIGIEKDLPASFKAIVHIGCLNSTDTPVIL